MIPPTWIIGGVMAVTIAGGGWFILHQQERLGEQALQIKVVKKSLEQEREARAEMAKVMTRYSAETQAASEAERKARDSIAAARRRVSAARVSGGDAAAAQEAADALAGAFGGSGQ